MAKLLTEQSKLSGFSSILIILPFLSIDATPNLFNSL